MKKRTLIPIAIIFGIFILFASSAFRPKLKTTVSIRRLTSANGPDNLKLKDESKVKSLAFKDTLFPPNGSVEDLIRDAEDSIYRHQPPSNRLAEVTFHPSVHCGYFSKWEGETHFDLPSGWKICKVSLLEDSMSNGNYNVTAIRENGVDIFMKVVGKGAIWDQKSSWIDLRLVIIAKPDDFSKDDDQFCGCGGYTPGTVSGRGKQTYALGQDGNIVYYCRDYEAIEGRVVYLTDWYVCGGAVYPPPKKDAFP